MKFTYFYDFFVEISPRLESVKFHNTRPRGIRLYGYFSVFPEKSLPTVRPGHLSPNALEVFPHRVSRYPQIKIMGTWPEGKEWWRPPPPREGASQNSAPGRGESIQSPPTWKGRGGGKSPRIPFTAGPLNAVHQHHRKIVILAP